MHLLFSLIALTRLATTVTPVVVVDDRCACMQVGAFEQELQGEPLASASIQPVLVEVGLAPNQDACAESSRFSVHLDLSDQEGVLLAQRTLMLDIADCPHAHRLLASIVTRELMALPVVLKVRQIDDAPSLDDEGTQTRARIQDKGPYQLSLRVGAAVGGGFLFDDGVVGQAPTAVFEPRLLFFASAAYQSLPRANLLLSTYGYQHNVANGKVQIFGPQLGLGIGYDLNFDTIALVPELMVVAGLNIGSGVGFRTTRSFFLPTLAVGPRLTVHSQRGFFIMFGVDVALIRSRLRVEGAQLPYTEPWVKAYAAAGLSADFLK